MMYTTYAPQDVPKNYMAYTPQEVPKSYMVHYNNNNNNDQFLYALEPLDSQQRVRSGSASKFVMAFGMAGCCILFLGFVGFFIVILLNEQGYIR